jgi:excisionase family DNA binding protein
MKTYIPTQKELKETVSKAVEQVVSRRLPQLIKEATRKDYYTIKEVCEMLDVSRRHLQYLRDSGQLSYVKSGRKIYFKAEDLEQFFDHNYIEAQKDKEGCTSETKS